MGYNTVAFLLNDFMGTLKDSPNTIVKILSHPRMSKQDRIVDWTVEGERPVHSQALEVLPTFHADEQKFFVAGGNCITELTAIKLGVSKEGKKTVTLELPDWFEPRWFLKRPKNWPKK
jgi:hypothetical protein